jgi:hypothetical protein
MGYLVNNGGGGPFTGSNAKQIEHEQPRLASWNDRRNEKKIHIVDPNDAYGLNFDLLERGANSGSKHVVLLWSLGILFFVMVSVLITLLVSQASNNQASNIQATSEEKHIPVASVISLPPANHNLHPAFVVTEPVNKSNEAQVVPKSTNQHGWPTLSVLPE